MRLIVDCMPHDVSMILNAGARATCKTASEVKGDNIMNNRNQVLHPSTRKIKSITIPLPACQHSSALHVCSYNCILRFVYCPYRLLQWAKAWSFSDFGGNAYDISHISMAQLYLQVSPYIWQPFSYLNQWISSIHIYPTSIGHWACVVSIHNVIPPLLAYCGCFCLFDDYDANVHLVFGNGIERCFNVGTDNGVQKRIQAGQC